MQAKADNIRTWLLFPLLTAALWVGLYRFNGWFFSSFSLSSYISWIFLPAAVRLLSVMVIGWPAAVGLWLGTFITCEPVLGVNVMESVEISSLSALGPVMAVALCTRGLRLPHDLSGLRTQHMAIFSLIAAACNVLPHVLLFAYMGKVDSLSAVIPMFAGDVTGTWVVLYVASALLRLAL
jgi:hypothetical protein